MKKFINRALLFMVCLSCSAFAQTKPAKAHQSRLIVGYLADFRLDDYSIKELERRGAAKRLTHIIYAFVNIKDGLYQKPTGDVRHERYNKLKDLKGFQLFRDSETKALWLFNRQTGVFWSFDDPVSLSIKMDYVKQRDLGGVMFWEISGDDKDGSLLKAIYRKLRQQ